MNAPERQVSSAASTFVWSRSNGIFSEFRRLVATELNKTMAEAKHPGAEPSHFFWRFSLACQAPRTPENSLGGAQLGHSRPARVWRSR